ncbi:hypothetical protein [Ligilactobacillus salivarius]|uniref:hypothetical protein n=1 Tax=Ligilactobacillus salivarius TaxID=1624 RepID=UPI0036691838
MNNKKMEKLRKRIEIAHKIRGKFKLIYNVLIISGMVILSVAYAIRYFISENSIVNIARIASLIYLLIAMIVPAIMTLYVLFAESAEDKYKYELTEYKKNIVKRE